MRRTNKQRKLFESAAAAYILGVDTDLRLKGREEQVEATKKALSASKRLYEALRSSKPLPIVRELIESKRDAAERFKLVFGFSWPF